MPSGKDLGHLAAEMDRLLRESVVLMVGAGMGLAETRGKLGPHFPRWCAEACGLSLAEAELLMRHALSRPQWQEPAAVDLSDAVAWELTELGLPAGLRAMEAEADG